MSSEPERRRIPLSVPSLEGNERAYLAECVDTNWVSPAGPFVGRFEAAVAEAVGADHAVATTSGTAALHVALQVAGVGPGDAVVTSALTFVATANAVRYLGAEPVFADVDAATWQMDPDIVVRYLTKDCDRRGAALHDRSTGRRVAAVLPAHILGHPVDMEPIVDAARSLRVPVVEDAAEALGAAYRRQPAGTLGDIGCFSFNGNKLVTCGGGGMVVTRDRAVADRVRHLTTQAKSDPVESVHDAVGYNYRLTNVQAAVGCAQMERLANLVAARRQIAECYRAAFADVPGLTFMPEASWAHSTFWLSTVLVDADAAGIDRRGLAATLAASGIETRPLWQPLHHSPAHAGAKALGGAVADRLNRDALSLPSSASLTESDQDRVIDAVLAAVR